MYNKTETNKFTVSVFDDVVGEGKPNGFLKKFNIFSHS